MGEFSMVYYNNLLSLPCIFVLMYMFGELPTLTHQPALSNPAFLIVAGLGGLIGFAISFSSLWFLSQVCDSADLLLHAAGAVWHLVTVAAAASSLSRPVLIKIQSLLMMSCYSASTPWYQHLQNDCA